MKINYDAQVDILTIRLNDGIVRESDEEKPGFIFDYDEHGNLIRIEILNASQKVGNPSAMEYVMTPWPLSSEEVA
jgi:uncharacterized protein YuzE